MDNFLGTIKVGESVAKKKDAKTAKNDGSLLLLEA